MGRTNNRRNRRGRYEYHTLVCPVYNAKHVTYVVTKGGDGVVANYLLDEGGVGNCRVIARSDRMTRAEARAHARKLMLKDNLVWEKKQA